MNNIFTFKKQDQISRQLQDCNFSAHNISQNSARACPIKVLLSCYECSCVNKITWAFFYPGFRISVLLSCSAVSFSQKYGRNQQRTAQCFNRHWPFRSWSTGNSFMSSFGFDFLHFPRKLWAFHSRLSVNWIKSSHTNQSIKCVVFLTSQWGRLFTFLCVVKILHSITIKGFFTQILVVALLQKNLLMLLAVRLSNYGCTWEVWRAIKKPRLELLLRIFRALQTSRVRP